MVLILHPFSGQHSERQSETWDFLRTVRERYTVVDKLCEGKYGYNDFLAENWGKGEDIVIVEMDMVPTIADLEELVSCSKTHCNFPYRPGLYPIIRLKNFETIFFTEFWGMGFARISSTAQEQIPIESWNRASSWLILDRSIATPLISKFGHYHLHKRLVKHNHPYNWNSPRRVARGLLLSAEVLLNYRIVNSSFKPAADE